MLLVSFTPNSYARESPDFVWRLTWYSTRGSSPTVERILFLRFFWVWFVVLKNKRETNSKTKKTFERWFEFAKSSNLDFENAHTSIILHVVEFVDVKMMLFCWKPTDPGFICGPVLISHLIIGRESLRWSDGSLVVVWAILGEKGALSFFSFRPVLSDLFPMSWRDVESHPQYTLHVSQ